MSILASVFSPTTGIVGEKEFGPSRVTITWINGIKNDKKKCEAMATRIADAFDGAKVHFFHNKTNGLHKDFIDAIRHYYGAECKEAKELANHLREVLKTAERVIHIAHSHGGIITSKVVPHLTADERSRIDVVIFGSPTIIEEGIFGSVIHYVSKKDPIPVYNPKICRIVKGKENSSTVVALPSSIRFDHKFRGITYQKALKTYAATYTQTH